MIACGAACARHRDALLDFVDRREDAPGIDAALGHLETCAACVWELEATAMAIAALRRLHAEVRQVEPSPDAWARLRTRVERPREAVWRWRSSLVGLAVGAGLVATTIAPASTWSPRSTLLQEAGLEPSYFSAQRLQEDLAEVRIRDQRRAARAIPEAAVVKGAPSAVLPANTWPGPDGLGTIGRETATWPPPADRSS